MKEQYQKNAGLECLVREYGFKSMLLEAQMEASPEAILITNIGGEILVYNKLFGDIWKISQNLFLTKDVRKLFEFILKQVKYPRNLQSFVYHLYDEKNEKKKIEIELTDERFFEINSSPMISKNGEILGRAWFLRDITQQKKHEEEVENIFSILNHDLKSPAAAIVSFSNLLLDDEFSLEETKYIIKIINTSGEKMLEMMKNYLTLLKIERDEKNIEMNVIEVSELISEIENLLIELNFQNHFKILTENPDNFRVNSELTKKTLLLQKNLFWSLLTNLFTNAVEAMEGKNNDVENTDKKISINLYEDKGLMYLSITNEGKISEEVKKNLFQKFNTSKKNGNGLGLYSAKLIARIHGGEIAYKELPGATRFVVTLPLH